MRYRKVMLGLLLAFVVGFVCQLAHIPVPVPPVLGAALPVFLISCAYWLTRQYPQRRAQQQREAACSALWWP